MNEGIRPINNVVDVTNYILLYFGQPMHAFDLDTFEGTDIRVREARAGEKLVTLDGEERDLETNDLVITVADKPVALAGVMGGQATEISEKSSRVVLEAAVFNGKSIRKTSGRLNLRSESSSRFEKGINVATVNEALDAAASMIAELAGATVRKGIVSAGELDTSDVEVSSTLADVNRVLGTDLSYADVEDVFRRLGLVFLEMQTVLQSASHAVAGISLSRQTSLKKSLVSMDMTACQPAFQKTMGQLVN